MQPWTYTKWTGFAKLFMSKRLLSDRIQEIFRLGLFFIILVKIQQLENRYKQNDCYTIFSLAKFRLFWILNKGLTENSATN